MLFSFFRLEESGTSAGSPTAPSGENLENFWREREPSTPSPPLSCSKDRSPRGSPNGEGEENRSYSFHCRRSWSALQGDGSPTADKSSAVDSSPYPYRAYHGGLSTADDTVTMQQSAMQQSPVDRAVTLERVIASGGIAYSPGVTTAATAAAVTPVSLSSRIAPYTATPCGDAPHAAARRWRWRLFNNGGGRTHPSTASCSSAVMRGSLSFQLDHHQLPDYQVGGRPVEIVRRT
jgi:hypothetical protein